MAASPLPSFRPAPLVQPLRLLALPGSQVSRVPEGTRLYAIGDTHGRRDLLTALLEAILADIAATSPVHSVLITLGDYIDRGRDSAGVIDLLARLEVPGLSAVSLRGNHEDVLLDFLAERSTVDLATWVRNGADAMFASYGVTPPDPFSRRELSRARKALQAAMPPRHLEWLEGLELCWSVGDYFFAHAGVRPGVALGKQADEDLMWIRGAFLDDKAWHGKRVVHGHTIVRQVELRANRIGIDTGAYRTERLTALVLWDDQAGVLQTG